MPISKFAYVSTRDFNSAKTAISGEELTPIKSTDWEKRHKLPGPSALSAVSPPAPAIAGKARSLTAP